jgi:hypothetical protein
MEDKLKNLKEIMDKTTFKTTTFDSHEQTKILNRLYKREKLPKFNLNSLLSFATCSVLFIGIGVFVFNQLNGVEGNQMQGNTTFNTNEEQKSLIKDKDESKESEAKKNEYSYPYIVLNGFYYKKTNEVIKPEKLGEKIAEVKRIGDWAIKQSGDSNEIAPGPIYSVKGSDPTEYIASKGVINKEGKNQSAYIVFEKHESVEQPPKDSILSSKGDIKEVQIALENIKEEVVDLYQFTESGDRVSLFAANHLKENGPGAELIYNVPEANKKEDDQTINGILFIYEYKKELPPSQSRFNQNAEWERIKKGNEVIKQKKDIKMPIKIEEFYTNGIHWSYYKDQEHQDFILRGEKNNMYYEVITQGEFTLESLKTLLEEFKQTK